MIETLCVPIETMQRAVRCEKIEKQEENNDFGILISRILGGKDTAGEQKKGGASPAAAENDGRQEDSSDSSQETKESRPEISCILGFMPPPGLFPREPDPESNSKTQGDKTAGADKKPAAMEEIGPDRPKISAAGKTAIRESMPPSREASDEGKETIGPAAPKGAPREEKMPGAAAPIKPTDAKQTDPARADIQSGLPAAESKPEKSAYSSDGRESALPETRTSAHRAPVIKGDTAQTETARPEDKAGAGKEAETGRIPKDAENKNPKGTFRFVSKSGPDTPEQERKSPAMQTAGAPLIKEDFSQIKIHPPKEEGIDTGQTDILEQIGAKVSQLAPKEGTNTFRMKLFPEGLGEITVTMDCQDSQLTLRIQTDNTATQKLIEDRAGELKAALLTKHYEVADLRVEAGQNAESGMRGEFSFFGQDRGNRAYDQSDHRPAYGYFENLSRSEEKFFPERWENPYTAGRLNYRV